MREENRRIRRKTLVVSFRQTELSPITIAEVGSGVAVNDHFTTLTDPPRSPSRSSYFPLSSNAKICHTQAMHDSLTAVISHAPLNDFFSSFEAKFG